jgi:hypothetical protein
LRASFLCLALVACTTHAPCKSGTLVVTLDLDVASAEADSLTLDLLLDDGARDSQSVTHQIGVVQETIEVDFQNGYPAGHTLTITASATSNGAVVGSGSHAQVLAAGCTSGFSVDIVGSPDMASFAPDLSPEDLSSEEDLRPGADLSPEPDLRPEASSPDLAVPRCTSSVMCGDLTQPICDSVTMTCRACQGSSDDAACLLHGAGLRCAPSGGNAGRCVACLTNADCQTATPTCGADGSCRKCLAPTDCNTGVCDLRAVATNGQCAAASDIVYVDTAATCAGADGSLAKPYCQISDALSNLGSRPFIHVQARATHYNGLSLGTTNLTVYFAGAAPGGPQPIIDPTGANNEAVDAVAANGISLDVTFDGFQFNGAAGSSTINCDGSATLTVRNSLLSGGDRGLRAVKCNATLSESLVNGAAIEGVAFEALSMWDMHNCIITGATGVGARINSAGTFRFNTLALNGVVNTAGGVNCQSTANLESSIITANSRAGGSGFAGTCTLSNVVTGSDSIISSGKITSVPSFVSLVPPDLHLKVDTIGDLAKNLTCCIDKVSPNGVSIDFDREARPRGANADIGADEAL